VPVGVVDGLEVVDVEDAKRHGGTGPPGSLDLTGRLAAPCHVVQQPGLAVDAGLAEQLRVLEAALERDHQRDRVQDRQRAVRGGERRQRAER
jgi:hypothetical protein